MSDDYYIDIHCHPTFLPYNRSCTEKTGQPEFWPPAAPSPSDKERKKDTLKFLQSDFTTLSQSKVRVVFAALLPLEQGFLWHNSQGLARMIARLQMKIRYLRACNVQTPSHDYFADLKNEYELLTTATNWQSTDGLSSAQVVSNYVKLCELFAPPGPKPIAVVVTIEGGHSLGAGNQESQENIDDNDLDDLDDISGSPMTEFELDPSDSSFSNPTLASSMVNKFQSPDVQTLVRTLLLNVQTMKSWGPEGHTGWFAPFFITFSHHFWNQLCGHQISLPYMDIVKFLSGGKRESPPDLMIPTFDQVRGVEAGMTEVGKVVVCALLSKQNGKRVLIDCKHMSMSGKDWYYGCVENYNAAHGDGDKIPIISSHSAVNGRAVMRAEADNKSPGVANENYETSLERFNTWDINLTDQEILRIHESDGLIGLNFDERILAGKQWRKTLHQVDAPTGPHWAGPIAEHIYHIASVVAPHIDTSGPNSDMWGRVAMGTDSDGAINPLDAYCRATDLTNLELDLKDRLIAMRDSPSGLEYGLTTYPLLAGLSDGDIATIVSRFMRNNAMHFLSTYFTDDYRGEGG